MLTVLLEGFAVTMASDPFPLVLPSNFFEETSRERPAGRRSARRRARRDWTRKATEDIFSSLNALATARASHTPQPGRVRQTSTLTPSQESALDRVVRSVARHGPPPSDLRPREAFQELLKSSNIYSEEGRLTVRPFDQGKVSLLQGSVEPREALDLVPDHVRQVLEEPARFLERHSDELADEPHVEPYWDPVLNPRVRANHQRLLALLRRLADMGIVVATRRKKATVGLFFVEKKGDRLRMIVDGRQPNQFHRLPPQTSMASVEALAAVQVGADWRQRCSIGSDEAALYAASVDLKDGFHQFKIPHLSEWFVFDMPGVRAMDLGVQQVYDGDVGGFVDVAPDDYVWPAYGGLAMGWSWALWICHETLAHVMRASAGPRDATVLDKAPAAHLEPGMVGDLPYVDNANVIGVEREVVQARLERMTAALDLLGLKWHEKQDAAVEVEILGVIVDGVQGLVRPKPKRLWRLYSGLTFLLKWRKAAGWQVRAVLGHLVSFFQLLRPGLAIFRVLYDFVQQDLGEIRELPPAALHELKLARSLLFMAAGRWGLPACPVAFMTDASMKGYALLETDTTPEEVHDLCRFRERARFSRREKFVEREHDGFRGSLAVGDAGEGWWDGLLERAKPRGPVPERCRVEVDSGWRPPPLPDDFVDPKRWELVVAGAWRDASRIHDYEARCGLMGLARAASYVPYHDTELLSAGDNMGSVLAFEKGRAANRELLAQCRRAAALQMASGIVWRQRHVEGARNAADYMSRAADRGLLQPGQVWRGPRGRLPSGRPPDRFPGLSAKRGWGKSPAAAGGGALAGLGEGCGRSPEAAGAGDLPGLAAGAGRSPTGAQAGDLAGLAEGTGRSPTAARTSDLMGPAEDFGRPPAAAGAGDLAGPAEGAGRSPQAAGASDHAGPAEGWGRPPAFISVASALRPCEAQACSGASLEMKLSASESLCS